MLLLCLAWLLVAAQASQSADELHPTNLWVDFVGMGKSTLYGQPLLVGAVVRAYDAASLTAACWPAAPK